MDFSENFLLLLKTLVNDGLTPTYEGSDVADSKSYDVKGFGSFQVSEYESYTGRSMQTGKEVIVPAKLVLTFTIDPELADLLKNKDKYSSSMTLPGNQSDLELKLGEIRAKALSGETELEFPGVGTFKVASQEKSSGIKFFILLHTSEEFNERLQKIRNS